MYKEEQTFLLYCIMFSVYFSDAKLASFVPERFLKYSAAGGFLKNKLLEPY